MINTRAYIEKCLKIRDKNAKVIPLKLNAAQKKLYGAIKAQRAAGKPVRAIILKARQMGFSTLAEAMIFKHAATRANVSCGIAAHEIAATNNLFNMSKRYYDNLDADLKPPLKASNAKELIFDFASGASSIKCMTAGNANIGRSDTYNHLHISEYAFWTGDKQKTLIGLLQSVPNHAETTVIIESTANGYDDFKSVWDEASAGENDYIPIFCGWNEHAEYTSEGKAGTLSAEERELRETYHLTDGQIVWRRQCIANHCRGDGNLFRQEYPISPEEAFLLTGRPVFDNEKIARRIAVLRERYKENPYDTVRFIPRYDAAERIVSYGIEKGRDIAIYKRPEANGKYCIGADTKGEGRDFYAATVIDVRTGERCASLHMQINESKPFTHQLYCLGAYYNGALLSVEMNFNTAPIEELARLRYKRQYIRRKYDDMSGTYQKKYGWKTDGNTRPLIIDKEIGQINHHIENFSDIATLQEAMTFCYDDNGRPDAQSGAHDDLLISDMIANETREQYPLYENQSGASTEYEREMTALLHYGG